MKLYDVIIIGFGKGGKTFAEYSLRDQIFTHPTMSEAMNDLFAAVR